MGLTALEWLLLPEKEQIERGHELSPHECFLLRTSYSYVKFTEEEKANMSLEERERIIHPPKREPTEEEIKMSKMTLDETIEYLFGDIQKMRRNND